MTANPSFVSLNAADLEHLLMTLERALEVQTRAQFFLWAQGALQGFIAHESLWCAHGDIDRMQWRVEFFSRGPTSERVQSQVTDRTDGLMPRLVDDWIGGGRRPRLLSNEAGDQVGRRQLVNDLRHCGFDHAVAHGVREIQGSHGSFFVLAGMDHVPNERDAYLLELLMPHMHLALHRMRMRETAGHRPEAAPVALLSKRELQVLHWVKNGKTNLEISQILGISPPTVKNHLQKVMRKLNVNNRAQAVGKSAMLRLLSHSDLNEAEHH